MITGMLGSARAWFSCRPCAIWLAISVLCTLALLVLPAGSPLFAIIPMAMTIVVLILAIRSLLLAPSERRGIWLAMVLGLAFIATGMVVSALTTGGSQTHPLDLHEAPTPLFLLGYSCFVVAAWLVVSATGADADRASVLDGLVLLVAGGLLSLQFVIGPLWTSKGGNLSQLWPYIAFCIVDLLLISLVGRMWFSTTSTSNRWVRLMALGLAGAGLTQLLVMASTASPELGLGAATYLRLGYLVMLALLGAAAVERNRYRVTEADPGQGLQSRTRTLVMLAIALIAPLVVHISDDARGSDLDESLLLPISLVILILVMVRVALLLKAYQDSASRNSVVRELATEYVVDRHDLDSRMPRWIASVIGKAPAEARIVEPGESWKAPYPHVEYFPTSTDPDDPRLGVAKLRPISPETRRVLGIFALLVGSILERFRLRSHYVELGSAQRLGELLANSADAIVIVDSKQLIEYSTPALTTLTGTSDLIPGEVPMMTLVVADDRDIVSALISAAMSQSRSTAEFRLANPEGERLCAATAVWHTDEHRCVLTLHDITEQRQLQELLTERALYDQLTGLANRELFRDRLEQAVSRRRRTGEDFAVLMLDLDDFKSVNDTLGHPAGDELLCEVASRLTEMLRESDTAARLGGDEFALILEQSGSTQVASSVADRLIARLSDPVTIQGSEVIPVASIGVVGSEHLNTAEEAERNADLALYEAKDSGKNRWALFEPELLDAVVRRTSLVSELRAAIEREEIVPWYQPIVELSTGALAGIEALARWEHPERGLISPAEFIPVAEESGLIVELGRAMIARSLHELAFCHRIHPHMSRLRLTINLSPRQMSDPGLVDHVRASLDASGVPAEQLVFEITEGVLLPNGGVPFERLQALHELGIDVYIDDFGTGWSSLSYLRTMPVAGMKLAREFVSGLPHPSQIGMVTAIRDLATNLDLAEIVAEGIETETQRTALIQRGYRLGQGYLLGRPAPPMELAPQLATMEFAEWEGPSTSGLVLAPLGTVESDATFGTAGASISI